MSKGKWIIGGLLAVAVLAAGGWFLTHRNGQVRLLTGEVTKGPIDANVSATGTVNPVIMVQVGSQVSGTVSQLHADYNSRVTAGQVLLRLDPAIYDAQLAQAQANLEKARVTVSDALRAYKRAQELFTQNYISQSDRDAAETAWQSAVASEKQSRAAVNLAKVNLDHCTITSPISGQVISRSVDVGQTVAASLQAPELFRIANDLTRMQVETAIDEADIGKLQIGQRVTFTVDAYPDETFHGRVTLIRSQPITVQNVVTYTTVIEVPNPDLKLRPGMTANVSILVAHRDDVLKVPNAALRFKPADDVAAKLGLNTKDDNRTGRGAGGAGPDGQAGARPEGGARAEGTPRAEGEARAAGAGGAAGGAVAGAAREGAASGGARRSGDMAARGAEGGSPTPEMRERWAKMRAAAGGDPATGQRGTRGAGGGEGGAAQGGMRGAGGWQGHGGGNGGQNGHAFRPPARVYVEVAPGKLKQVTIRTGLSDGSFTEVVGGDLQPGTKVATGVLGAAVGHQENRGGPMGGPMGGPPGGRR